MRCYHSGPEWTWERLHRRGTLHSVKLQHYWSLTVRLFSVINRTLVERVLPLCREAVGVFCSPSRQGHRTLAAGSYPSVEKQSVCSATPADRATGHSLQGLTPLQRSSQCVLQPQPTGPQDTRCRVLPLCREAVNVFCNPSRQGHRTLAAGSYPSAEKQSVCSATPVDWANWIFEVRWFKLLSKKKIKMPLISLVRIGGIIINSPWTRQNMSKE